MVSFKEFLAEKARKQKEPDWPDADYSSGYAELRDFQRLFTLKPDRLELQLFVPKRRDPKQAERAQQDRRWREAGRELEAQLKEEKPPVLSGFREQPPGDNKPHNAFWTSTALQNPDGTYTSDWYMYVQRTFPSWQTDYGYLFEIKKDALVFESDRLEQFYDWADRVGKMTKPVPDWASKYYDSTRLRSNFPWDILARHFDGVHHFTTYRDNDFTYGWDVESTAWFNTNKLIYKGAVRLGYGDDE